jgi:hypothetical protein
MAPDTVHEKEGKPNVMSRNPQRAGCTRSVDLLRAKLLPWLLLVSGCAGPMGTLRGVPPPPAPVTTFDGSYRMTLSAAGSFGSAQRNTWCESPGQARLTVASGQFSYAVPHPNVPGNPTPVYPATLSDDGSFTGQIVAGTIAGRIQGSRIEGSIDGSACLYSFTGERT